MAETDLSAIWAAWWYTFWVGVTTEWIGYDVGDDDRNIEGWSGTAYDDGWAHSIEIDCCPDVVATDVPLLGLALVYSVMCEIHECSWVTADGFAHANSTDVFDGLSVCGAYVTSSESHLYA